MTTVLYVLSVVAANLFVTAFGPKASIVSALVMIGATLTLRDKLHEEWAGKGLVLKMGAAIALAGLLSALLNAGATRIALASVVAFVVSETVDALLYHRLRGHPWLIRSNGSNLPAAAVDSLIFPTLAFGGFLPLVVLGQFAAKAFGGAFWAFVIRRCGWVAAAVLLCATPSSAQTVSLNGAWIHNPYVSAAAGEVFVSAPEVVHIRPYAVVSWNTAGGAEPTTILRLGYSRPVWKCLVGVGVGAIRLPADQFRPSVGGIVLGPSFGRLRPYVLAAYEQTPEWTWTTFVGLNYSIYFRK